MKKVLKPWRDEHGLGESLAKPAPMGSDFCKSFTKPRARRS